MHQEQTKPTTPRLLTLQEYADAIGKSARTVRRWLADGIIQSDMKLPGATGSHLFRADRVEADSQIEAGDVA